MIVIRKPTAADEKAVLSLRQELLDIDEVTAGDSRIPGGHSLEDDVSYSMWLKLIDEMELYDGSNGLVQALQFVGFDEKDNAVGVIQLRTALTDALRVSGGNIGYAVRPSERKKGYATEMLRQCLDIASRLGLNTVLVTCNDTNTASAKTIEKVGGILENTVTHDDIRKKRYLVSTTSQ